MSQEHCFAIWGNCTDDPNTVVLFGPPSETPHVCAGGVRHRAKLHVCVHCNRVGHRIRPLARSKAGKQFIAVIQANRRAKQ